MAISEGKRRAQRITHVQAAEVVAILRELDTPERRSNDPEEPLRPRPIDAEKLTCSDVARIVANRVSFVVNRTSVEHLAKELGIEFYREPRAVAEPYRDPTTPAEFAVFSSRLEMLEAWRDALNATLAELRVDVSSLKDSSGAAVDCAAGIEQKLAARISALESRVGALSAATSSERLAALPRLNGKP